MRNQHPQTWKTEQELKSALEEEHSRQKKLAQASQALIAAHKGDLTSLQHLIDNGTDINKKSSSERSETALHLAAMEGNMECARLLLESGADIEAKNRRGRSALQLAAELGQSAMVDFLAEMGADLEAKDCYGLTALHLAARHSHTAIVQVLVQRGADPRAKNSGGAMPACFARFGREREAVRLLLGRHSGAENDLQCHCRLCA
jgi:ankyrin repeat protein